MTQMAQIFTYLEKEKKRKTSMASSGNNLNGLIVLTKKNSGACQKGTEKKNRLLKYCNTHAAICTYLHDHALMFLCFLLFFLFV